MVHKKEPQIEEKISLKILPHPSTPEQIRPIQPPPVAPKPPLPSPAPKPIQQQVTTPPKTPMMSEIKPMKPMQVSPTPVITPSPVVSKIPEATPVVSVAKAPPIPPPAPKAAEHYEEENLGKIRNLLADRLKYPKNALRLKQQGEASIAFTLNPDRTVSQISITQSSGFEILDDAARTLIEATASEFPKPSKPVRINVPIAYKLR